MTDQESIKETLDIIRKALEDDEPVNNNLEQDNFLLLNKLVKKDGTIEIIKNENLKKEEVKEILNTNISQYFEKNFDQWLKKNIPNYLDKYFKKNNS